MNAIQTAERQTERGTIMVQRIFPAKAQGKSAYIKDVDGMMFGIWPDKLGLIREGESYEIEFTSKVSNGTTYRDIKNVRMIAKPQPAPEQFTSAAAPAPKVGPPKENDAGGGGQYFRPTAPRDSERMFVCSTLNAFIQTGRIDLHQKMLTECILELRAAYAATFGQDDPR